MNSKYRLLEDKEILKIKRLVEGGCGYEMLEVMRDAYAETREKAMEQEHYSVAREYGKIASIFSEALDKLEEHTIDKVM